MEGKESKKKTSMKSNVETEQPKSTGSTRVEKEAPAESGSPAKEVQGIATQPLPSEAKPTPTGESADDEEDTIAARTATIRSIRKLLEPHEISPSREDLQQASRQLKKVDPYNYDAWRVHADLLLTALRQLETRALQPDANFTILAIPLREDDLRDAAEDALRQCAHFADSAEKQIKLVDEANKVRRMTWF